MQLNICFDEMASFGPFADFIKGCSTCDRGGRNGRQPTGKYANPEDMTMFAVERHGLPEDFVSFRALCGVQSRHSYLRRIVRLSGAHYRGRQR